MSRTDPQNNQPRGPTQEEISAFELGRAIGRREGILRPCVPSGDACGAEGGDRPPAASVHDGQPGRQPATQQSPRKAQDTERTSP